MKAKGQGKILEKIANQEKPDILILTSNKIDLVKIYYV